MDTDGLPGDFPWTHHSEGWNPFSVVGDVLASMIWEMFSSTAHDEAADSGLPLCINSIATSPSMTMEEELQMLQEVDYLLKQVQYHLRMMDVDPIEIEDMKIVTDIPSRPRSRSRGPIFMLRKAEAAETSRSRLLNEKNREMACLVQEFSADVKSMLAEGVEENEISPDFARKLFLRIGCLDGNMKLAVKSSQHCFSFSGLVRLLTVPKCARTSLQKIKIYIAAFQIVLTMAACIIDNRGTTPGQYSGIGKEAGVILSEHFSCQKFFCNSYPCEKVFVTAGAQTGDDGPVSQLMFHLKGEDNSSFYFCGKPEQYSANAVPNDENDMVLAKISIQNLYERNTKCIVQCQFPSLDAKAEIEKIDQYCEYAGGFGLRRFWYPNFHLSCLAGVKRCGVGGLLTFDSETKRSGCAIGINMKSPLAALGFTYNLGGTLKAAFCRKLIDSATTVAATASFSPPPGVDQGFKFCVGVKHSFNPDVYVKAKAGTDGVSVALTKRWFVGKGSVKASGQMSFDKNLRRPTLGVGLSIC